MILGLNRLSYSDANVRINELYVQDASKEEIIEEACKSCGAVLLSIKERYDRSMDEIDLNATLVDLYYNSIVAIVDIYTINGNFSSMLYGRMNWRMLNELKTNNKKTTRYTLLDNEGLNKLSDSMYMRDIYGNLYTIYNNEVIYDAEERGFEVSGEEESDF